MADSDSLAVAVDPTNALWVAEAAHKLRRNGFVALRSSHTSLVPPDICSGCGAAIEQRLSRLLDVVRTRAQDFSVDEIWKFEEICHRHERSRRYDLSLPASSSMGPSSDAVFWAQLHRAAERWALPVINETVARHSAADRGDGMAAKTGAHRCMAGCVVAASESLDQPFHCDGDEMLFNCFIPLGPWFGIFSLARLGSTSTPSLLPSSDLFHAPLNSRSGRHLAQRPHGVCPWLARGRGGTICQRAHTCERASGEGTRAHRSGGGAG
mmetsp:Transcript_22179/g.44633  ORF Transcript_22179/g.44633 Transcript_22179/m.44633 type:complete len:267 (-) Transcript_22179:371-1171(-)